MDVSRMMAIAKNVLEGEDKASALHLADEINAAMYRILAEAVARQMLGTGPETLAVAPELLAKLAPKAPVVNVDVHMPEQPKRKSRTVEVKHDSAGRITSFETETEDAE
jgi:hypothetical protein